MDERSEVNPDSKQKNFIESVDMLSTAEWVSGFVTRDNKGDFYSIHVTELYEYTPGDTYVTPDIYQPLPEPTCAPAANVCEQISAAHKSWKEYYKHHKTKKPKKQRW